MMPAVVREDMSEPTLVESRDDGEVARPEGADFRLERGTVVDRYVVQGEIGAGGMGVVYAAYDPELDRKVALKLLHARPGSTTARGRLLREARAIAKLRHPNVVTVYDVGTHEGRVFLVMELVSGVTLRRWLRDERRSWRDVIAVLEQAGRGLQAAHAGELVHRDFKPDNVIVEAQGRAVVLDFGLARPLGGSTWGDEDPAPGLRLDTERTRTGMRGGTPAYMAPEQHAGRCPDARVDQFAFCVVAWEALLGTRPGTPDVSEEGARPSWPLARVPRAVRSALRRGLQADPDDRHANMQVLLQALARACVRPRRAVLLAWLSLLLLLGIVGVGASGMQLPTACRLPPGAEVPQGSATAVAP